MKLIKYLTLSLLFCSGISVAEQVKLETASTTVNAEITVPEFPGKKKAIVILHHAGGYNFGTTKQYAEFFKEKGYITLEPELFNGKPGRSDTYIPYIFSALKLLADREDVDKDNISIMGLSFGANLTIYSATSWANEKYNNSGTKFKSYASLYPVCFALEDYMSDTMPARLKQAVYGGYPDAFMSKWTQSPLAIFKVSDDDYEAKDSGVCQRFVDLIPDEVQRKQTTVKMYNGATHGWDQGRTFSFNEKVVNKFRGGTNTNKSDSKITELVKSDLLTFVDN